MLETILQLINSNLERIAKIQEETLIYMKEVDNKEETSVTENVVNGIAQSVAGQQLPISQIPEVQPTMPQPQKTIPTAQVQESFTQEQLAVAMSKAVSAGKMGVIQGILQQFGVQALTQINPTDYNKVATMLKEAGVEL